MDNKYMTGFGKENFYLTTAGYTCTAWQTKLLRCRDILT
jgi:hypothetical protein